MATNILIYEDNALLRESVTNMLQLVEGYKVLGSFAHCREVSQQVRKHKPHIILMDIDLPEVNGIEAVKKIREFDKKTQILMLTVFDDIDTIFKALSVGANGYLLKKSISEKLIPSIAEVTQGGAPMSPSVARKIISDMQKKMPVAEAGYQLTDREKEILQSLAIGNSFKMIAAELNISLDTVRTHIKHIYDKLHVRSQIEAVCKAYREKLV